MNVKDPNINVKNQLHKFDNGEDVDFTCFNYNCDAEMESLSDNSSFVGRNMHVTSESFVAKDNNDSWDNSMNENDSINHIPIPEKTNNMRAEHNLSNDSSTSYSSDSGNYLLEKVSNNMSVG